MLETVSVRERNPGRAKDRDNTLIYRSPQQMDLEVPDHWMNRSFSANKAHSLRDILQPSFSNESPLFHITPPLPRLPKTGQAHYLKHDKEHVCLGLPFEAQRIRYIRLCVYITERVSFWLHLKEAVKQAQEELRVRFPLRYGDGRMLLVTKLAVNFSFRTAVGSVMFLLSRLHLL